MAAKTSKKNDKVVALVASVALIVLGILFCLQKSLGSSLDLVLGIVLIVYGLFMVFSQYVSTKTFLGEDSILGGLVIALGSYFIMVSVIGSIIRNVVPVIFIVMGSLMVLEALCRFVIRKNKDVTAFVVLLLVGIAVLVIGVLLLTVSEVMKYDYLIVGITFIVLGASLLLFSLLGKR